MTSRRAARSRASGSQAKPINFANCHYISPKKGKRGGVDHLQGKLKYFQFRDDKHDYIPQGSRDRWVDMGLGNNYKQILTNCIGTQSKDVLAWTWVVSPAPDLMALVPEADRREFIKELTESTVTAYYEARGVDVPAYSYVLHDRNTEDGQQQLHSHVVLPGTVETLMGVEPFYNNKHDGHIELFNQIADKQLELALDAAIGVQWRELRPELLSIREPEAVQETADSELDLWFPR